MAVVRDITIDQLIQAVTGISTSGMSDSTGQSINSTLGTLGKDTSLQDIKTAINALANAISPAAANVTFDNTGTGMTASNVQAAIEEVNTKIPYINTLTFNANSSPVTINTTNYTDIVTKSFDLKAGSYIIMYMINATWSQGSYQFYPALKVGSEYVASHYSYANAQTNGTCVFLGRVTIPSDGIITLGISGKITNANKVVTIPAYQELGALMLSRVI